MIPLLEGIIMKPVKQDRLKILIRIFNILTVIFLVIVGIGYFVHPYQLDSRFLGVSYFLIAGLFLVINLQRKLIDDVLDTNRHLLDFMKDILDRMEMGMKTKHDPN